MTIRGRRCWDCRRLDSTSRRDSTSLSHGMTRARRAVRFAWVTTLLLVCPGTPAWSAEPPVLLHASPPSKAVVTLPGGDLSILYMVSGQHCASIRSGDGGATWSKPRVEFEFRKPAGVPVVLVAQEGELHAFLLVRRGGGRTPTVDYFYDIWHAATRDGRTRWSRPQRIFEGYVGALNGVVQLENGRIVLPHQFWVPGLRSEPPTGSHVVTTSYTDDGGRNWRLSPARLTSPCRSDYIGSNYGATEPVATQLRDGRVWMLIRTQTGFLYESFSPDGIEWSEARPTRFRSSNSPANLLRLPDGRLVVFWNNCENPSRVDGEPVYTTRDALHVAISADEGHTWAGYREAFRDPNRNQSPPRRGDRGTAYPFSTATREGQVILATGQGQGRIALVRIDPEWIGAASREDDFSSGLEGWSVFKPFGPAEYYWRARGPGPRLVDHPTRSGAKALQVRRPDDRSGDEAVWNFPAARRGQVSLRILLPEGSTGGVIALADRFMQPTEPAAERLEVFRLNLDTDGRIEGGPLLSMGRWHALRLSWDLDNNRCSVAVDGKPALVLPRLNYDSDLLSYLRLRSNAMSPDPSGMLIEGVAAMRDE